MPRAGDAFLLGQLPQSHNPLDRVSWQPPDIDISIEDLLDMWRQWLVDIAFPLIEEITGLDFSSPAAFVSSLINLVTTGGPGLDWVASMLTSLGDYVGIPNLGQFLTLLSGALQGFDFTEPGSIGNSLSGILNALQGINLNDPGSVLGAIQDTSEAFAEALIALIGGIPIIGPYMASLAAALYASIRNAVDAIKTATATQQIVGAPTPTPSWQGLQPGFSTFSLSTAGSETVTVTATTARIGFITPEQAAQLAGASLFVRKTGTVSTAHMDVYKLEPGGAMSRLWSSEDFASQITTSGTMAALQQNFPNELGLVSDLDDIYAIQVRITGAGSLTLVGKTFPAVSALTGYRPTQPGGVRDPSASPAPNSISDATMTSVYTNIVPYFTLARYAQDTSTGGGGPVLPPAQAKLYYDGFNRNAGVNPIRLGADWVSEQHVTDDAASPVGGYLSVVSNQVRFGPNPANGAYGVGRQGSLYKHSLATDKARVGYTVASANGVPAGVVGWAAANWSSWIGMFVTNVGATGTVDLRVGTSFSDYTTVASFPITLTTPGVQAPPVALWLEYDDETNEFTVTKDIDGSVVGTWEDSGNIVTHGDSYRYGGLYQATQSFTLSSPVDDFKLEELAAPGAVEPPPAGSTTQIDTFIDFRDMPDGAIPTTNWTTMHVTGVLPTVESGAMVNRATGTSPAASYLISDLSDGDRLAYATARFRFGASGTDGSQFTLVFWQYALPQGAYDGRLARSSTHIFFTRTGYVVQRYTTAGGLPGGVSENLYYATYLNDPGTNWQDLVVALDVTNSVLTITGADGVERRHPVSGSNSVLTDWPGYYACAEIYKTNPSTDKDVEVAYFGADSVIGGRVVLVQNMGQAALQPAAATALGGLPPVGTAQVGMQKLTASGAGQQHTQGTGAAAMQKAVAAGAGTHGSVVSGTGVAAIQKPVAAGGGAQSQSGTGVAAIQKPVAAGGGAQSQSGTGAASMQKAVASASGTHTVTTDTDNFNRADGAIGTGWTNQTANLMRVLSNQAIPTSTGTYAVMKRDTARSTAKHYAEITINTVNASDAYLIYVGAKTAIQAIAFIQPNSSIQIFTKPTGYGDLSTFTNRATASSAAAANGDVFRFECDGTGKFTIKRNGTALTGCTNIDLSAFVGTDGRDVLVGMLAAATTRGIDAFAAADF